MADAELEALGAGAGEAAAPRTPTQDLLLYLLKIHDAAALRRELSQSVMRDGVQRFVAGTAAPLVDMVGSAWARGEIQVFEEHLFTEQLQSVLRQAISQLGAPPGPPRVLLTTLPGEQHALGLLMAEAMAGLEGAACLSLGTQTPVHEIVAAARANRADVVALSASASAPQAALRESLAVLRAQLPEGTALWCGGAGAGALKRPPAGVRRIDSLAGVGEEIAAWRAQRNH
ncbi:MAG TPA: cobalamin-dependent protein [Burkholderiales bacterium]